MWIGFFLFFFSFFFSPLSYFVLTTLVSERGCSFVNLVVVGVAAAAACFVIFCPLFSFVCVVEIDYSERPLAKTMLRHVLFRVMLAPLSVRNLTLS